MQLNSTELPAVADAAVDAAAADAADATDGTDQEAAVAGAGGAQAAEAASVAGAYRLPDSVAAGAEDAAAAKTAAGGVSGDDATSTGVAAAAGPHTMYAAADAGAIAAAAAAAAAAGDGVDSRNEADDNLDQNPDTDDSRLASSSKKRTAAGAHDCINDCKRGKLQGFAQPQVVDSALTASAWRPARVGATAAAADVPLVKSAVGAVLLHAQAAAHHGGRASSGSSYDLGPM
jgi:hypothetical protein